MMMNFVSAVLMAVSGQAAQAAPVNVAVIDSGVDYRHIELKNKMWTNTAEINNNAQDDDSNGKVDDFYGWNFAESNGQIIDYKYLGTFSDDPYKFFELQLKSFNGTITDEEKAWIAAKRQDQHFIEEMQKFGNFVHGTHVAGIAAKGNADARVIGMKIIPTEVKKPFEQLAQVANQKEGLPEPIKEAMVKALLQQVAKANGQQLEPVGLYAYTTKSRVANCSFGSSVPALKEALAPLIGQIMGRELTDAEAVMYAKYTIEQMLVFGKQFAIDASETFFVIAAGNDGSDNDELPTYPANLKRKNTITVAATHGLSKIARFSNYGATTVEIAAPGVGIESSIPGNEYLKVSGTSQAAPFVSGVVARMLAEKSDLTFGQMKAILMGTVDKKDFLTDLVVSGGIANPERAVYAVRLMKASRSMADAISASLTAVADMKEEKLMSSDEGIFLPLPSLLAF